MLSQVTTVGNSVGLSPEVQDRLPPFLLLASAVATGAMLVAH
jgi:hypothetical protein